MFKRFFSFCFPYCIHTNNLVVFFKHCEPRSWCYISLFSSFSLIIQNLFVIVWFIYICPRDNHNCGVVSWAVEHTTTPVACLNLLRRCVFAHEKQLIKQTNKQTVLLIITMLLCLLAFDITEIYFICLFSSSFWKMIIA